MIDQELKNKIIATIGKHYTAPIIERLDSKEIFDAKGKSYSPGSISNIVCGSAENETVENEIIDFVADKIKEKLKVQNKRRNLLKK